ncbi:MAG: AAA family ATPase [Clostridia bacterium]|nr:AAA family ATPase [Clostridia bacterium]
MRITSLYIENFGVLHAYRLEMGAGLNVLCEKNGFGKTTLAAFIKAMLYGLPANRKTDLDENERKKYQPWQGGAFGGTMNFTARGKEYRCERFFAAAGSRKGDSFVLYDLADNMVSSDYTEQLGMELFGIDAEGFQRSAFLPQRLLSGGIDNATVTAKLNDLLDADEDPASYDRAAAVLYRQRQFYRRQGGRGRIAELEEKLFRAQQVEADCLAAETRCETAQAEAEDIDRALDEVRRRREVLRQEGETLSGMGTRAAVLSHGKMLLSERDRLISSAAEKRVFLGKHRTTEEVDALLSDAVGHETAWNVAKENLFRTRTQKNETTKQLAALREMTGLPGTEELPDIRAARDNLLYAREMLGRTTAENNIPDSDAPESGTAPRIPACLADEELERHMKQAAMYASEIASLEKPKTAKEARRQVYAAAGFTPDTILPDEKTMDAYADTLRALNSSRAKHETAEKTLSSDTAELEALESAGKDGNGVRIPEETELVAIRTRYDGLDGGKREIDALEEKQHAAAAARDDAHKRKKRRIMAGILLLLAGIVLGILYFRMQDVRLLPAAALPILLGIALVISGLTGDAPDVRVLDDDIFKRLCEKKSEYETDRTAVYEFLDRYAGESVLDTDAADRIFSDIAKRCRRREELRGAKDSGTKLIAALDAEAETLRLSLAALRGETVEEDGAETPSGNALPSGTILTDTETEEEFAVYREKVRRCADADREAAREAGEFSRSRARADALHMTLDAYLAQLAATPAAEYYTGSLPAAGDGMMSGEDYLSALTAWKTAADTLCSRLAAEDDARSAEREAVAALQTRILPWISAEIDAETTEVSVLAERILADAAERENRIQTLDAALAELENREAVYLAQYDAETAELETFLSCFYDAPYPDAGVGIRRVTETRRALDDDMNRLRGAQNALVEFCRDNAMTEDVLRTSEVPGEEVLAGWREALAQNTAALEHDAEQLQSARAAKRQTAETESARAAALPAVRETIADTRAALDDAAHHLDIVQKTQKLLDEAKTAMSTRYLGVMQMHFRRYYALLAGVDAEAADALSLDALLQPQMEVGGVRRESGYFSRGTGDLVNLCIRLALIDALYGDGKEDGEGEELPPVILDDPFVNLDEKRLSAARALLDRAAERYQILYFVCHESRA